MVEMKFQIKDIVMPLVILNVIFFILQNVLGRAFTDTFILVGGDVFARPWIMLTSMFLHGGPYHLLFNMYVLYAFGPLLEQRIGTKRFISMYLVSGILAAFVSSFFYPLSLGASGAIMGMLGVLIILMPDLKLLFFFVVPMQLWVAAIVFVVIDVFGILFPSGIGNIAHLVGMGVGLVYGLYLKKQRKKFHKKFSSTSHLDSQDVEDYLNSGRI
jgi:membrane associated rhomboid family serine protease